MNIIFKIARKRTVFASHRLSKAPEKHDRAFSGDNIYEITLERQYLNRKSVVKQPQPDDITAILPRWASTGQPERAQLRNLRIPYLQKQG